MWQVISSNIQVSGDNKHVLGDNKRVSGDSMTVYHKAGKWYRYKGSIRIQENGNDTWDWYEYKKMIPIQEISTKIGK